MIAVETVIRKLVSDLEFVIIPGFGALLSHQVPAVYDRDSGVFSPPVKKLAFNEYLKLDDGLLANYISREEKITHLDAVAYIKAYVDSLRLSLKSSGHTEIEGVGFFKTNVEGKLVFEPNTSNYFKDEWYGFKKVSTKIFADNVSSFTKRIESIDTQVNVASMHEVKQLNWMRWGAVAAIAGLVFFMSFFLMSNNKNDKSSLNPFENFGSIKPEVKNEDVVKKFIVSIHKTNKEIRIVKPNVKVTSGVNVVKINNNVNMKTLVEPDQKYYLIAGAFKGMRQAKVLLAEMQSKGYKDALIIPSGKNSKKVKVAVGGFDEQIDAYRASAKLKVIIGEDAWVYHNL